MMVNLPLRPLLESVVDYAGTFPPAGESLDTAMSAYATYQRQPYNWLLGRYVLLADALPVFIKELLPKVRFQAGLGQKTPIWPLSLVLREPNSDLSSSLLSSLHFYQANSYLSIAALEIAPQPGEALEKNIKTVKAQIPQSVETFVEIPLEQSEQTSYEEILTLLHTHQAMAKVRTGGLHPGAFPSVIQLARFISACGRSHTPFKATAGLHHPFYSQQRLPDGTWVAMHGFLNIAIATALTHYAQLTTQLTTFEITHLLQVKSLEGFMPWLNDILSAEQWSELCQLRKQFFKGFGSCSFQEPLEGLMQLQRLQDRETKLRINDDIPA